MKYKLLWMGLLCKCGRFVVKTEKTCPKCGESMKGRPKVYVEDKY